MNLSRGAMRLIQFLQVRSGRQGQCWWGQKKLAEALGYCVRSIGRWVAELVRAGSLESIRRGSTSNLYRPKDTGQNVRTDRTKCPNVSIELNIKTEKASLPALLAEANAIPATITNECGRVEKNPVRARLMQWWEVSQARFERADNPQAYAAAALSAELAKIRKPATSETNQNRHWRAATS